MVDGDVLSPRSGVLVTPAPVDAATSARRRARLIQGQVSVVLPAYNVEEHLETAVSSVLGQSYGHVHLVAIDDGSTDRTPEVLGYLAKQDPRLTFLTVPNGGPNAARNLALEHTRGEFLTFLDGDDVLLPGAYDAMVSALRAGSSDFVVAPYQRMREGEITSAAPWIRRAHTREIAGLRVEDRPSILVNAVQWSKMYRRSFWDDYVREFAVHGYYQDQLVSARAYGHSRAIDVITRPTVAWRVRDDGSSMTQQIASVPNMRDRFRTAREALEILGELRDEKVYKARLTQYLNFDFGKTISHVEGASEEYWEALVDEVRRFLELIPDRTFWDRVYAQHKVAYHLIRNGRRDHIEQFNDDGGRTLRDFPFEVCDDGVFVHLPFWGDERVPRWCFKAAARQARSLQARSHEASGGTLLG